MFNLRISSLELLERLTINLTFVPNSIQRQTVLYHFHQILKYWQGQGGAETTAEISLKELDLVNRIYRNLSNLGSESLVLSKEEPTDVQEEVPI